MTTNEKAAAATIRLAATAEQHGGAYEEPEAYRGSRARTMFDRPNAKDGTVAIILPEDEIPNLPRQSLVKIRSFDRRSKLVDSEYVGMVVAGPFAEPDAMDADAPTLKVPAVHRAVLTPRFHGMASVEILGIESELGGRKVMLPARSRPAPNSPVFSLDESRVAEILGLVVEADKKPVRLGLMNTVADIAVYVPANQKSVLPRHTGILGTTGGGKSTTVSGLAKRLADQRNAIVIFDAEGEYAAMNEPTSDPVMLKVLEERGLSAEGAKDTALYALDGRDFANPRHGNKKKFKLDFADISIGVLTEILDVPEAQQSRLQDAYDICKVLMEKFEIFPRNKDERPKMLEVDELETGWPRMTLEMLIDIVDGAIAVSQKAKTIEGTMMSFADKDEVFNAIKTKGIAENKFSWLGLKKRLWTLRRAKIFLEQSGARETPLDVEDMLTPGRISIIDLHDMDAPYLRNIVIAQILRRIQSCQDEKYAALQEGGNKQLVPVNIFIEEAHEFLSDKRIRQMPGLFDQVVRIARRGRKRHIGLVFVTQLPGHLPDEVLGLINNWVLHKIGDMNVIQRLKKIVAGADEGTWSSLNNLPSGNALASFTHMTRPVTVAIDPTPCKLLMVD
ncbi:ATP-binding protein [Bradyrhizobium barranii]|uniref:ATP-binding protein n=1 Tax=Bradyrhizobium barranii TaxID=2992140 RepID=UPI0024AF41FF|nr:ATP-binding protein [Bradyrhizobium barranii]WFT94388.1 ATP-binding protein [Bradyrhizobium barranii]